MAVCFARSNCYNPRVPSAITDTEKSHSTTTTDSGSYKTEDANSISFETPDLKKNVKKKKKSTHLVSRDFGLLYKIFSRTTRSVYMTVSNCTIFNKLMLLYIINLHVKNDLLSFHN